MACAGSVNSVLADQVASCLTLIEPLCSWIASGLSTPAPLVSWFGGKVVAAEKWVEVGRRLITQIPSRCNMNYIETSGVATLNGYYSTVNAN